MTVSEQLATKYQEVQGILALTGINIDDKCHGIISQPDGKITAVIEYVPHQGLEIAWGRLTGITDAPGICVHLCAYSRATRPRRFVGPILGLFWYPRRDTWELEFAEHEDPFESAEPDEPMAFIRSFIARLDLGSARTSRLPSEDAALEVLRRMAECFLAYRRRTTGQPSLRLAAS